MGRTKLTVSSVLSMEVMKGAEILAGRTGVSNEVCGVNIIEVPEVTRWLQGGELLLSSGYPFRERLNEFPAVIRAFSEIGVAALGYKPGGWLDGLPQVSLELADELALPILQLPEELAYRDVFEAVYVRLYGRSRRGLHLSLASELELPDNVHSMRHAAGRLATHFGWRVEIRDFLEGVVHAAGPDGRVDVNLAPDLPLQEPADRGGDVGDASEDPIRVRRISATETSIGLFADGQVVGSVTVEDASGGGPVETEILLDVAETLALVQVRRRAYVDGQQESLAWAFDLLARGDLDPRDAADRALLLGLREGRNYTVAIMVFPHDHGSAGLLLRRLRALATLHLRDDLTIVGTDPGTDEMTVLLRAEDVEGPVDRLRSLATRVFGTQTDVRAGISQTVSRVEDLPQVVRQARICVEVARGRTASSPVHFDELGADAVLLQVPDSDITRQFVQNRLACVEDPELLRTLVLYVDHHGNKSATADAVPMHRSGLMYRLEKIGEIMNVDLNDSTVMNEIWLAVQLQRIQSYQRAPSRSAG